MNSKNDKKKYIFIIGSGCSGNSAITDWMVDNCKCDTSVFSGDFEELRDRGGIIDAMTSRQNKYFCIKFFKFLIMHNLRLLLRAVYLGLRGKSRPNNPWQVRNSIKRYLRRVALCKVLDILGDHQYIKRYLVIRHLASLSSRKTIVLNNPLFANKQTFQVINSLGIDFEIIFTYRNFALQFEEWKRLNYSGVNEKKLLELNEISDPFRKFEEFQRYILSQRVEIAKIAKVQFISFDRFVLDSDYRSTIWSKVFGEVLTNERFYRFNPVTSQANTCMEKSLRMSSTLDLIADTYHALS